jgi:hypothetical protein
MVILTNIHGAERCVFYWKWWCQSSPSNFVFPSVRIWFSTEHDNPEDTDEDADADADDDDYGKGDGDGSGDGDDDDDDDEGDEDEDEDEDTDDKNEGFVTCRISFYKVGFHAV